MGRFRQRPAPSKKILCGINFALAYTYACLTVFELHTQELKDKAQKRALACLVNHVAHVCSSNLAVTRVFANTLAPGGRKAERSRRLPVLEDQSRPLSRQSTWAADVTDQDGGAGLDPLRGESPEFVLAAVLAVQQMQRGSTFRGTLLDRGVHTELILSGKSRD